MDLFLHYIIIKSNEFKMITSIKITFFRPQDYFNQFINFII